MFAYFNQHKANTMKLAEKEMEHLLDLLNRAIRSEQLIIPTRITDDNEIQCTEPQHAIMLHPHIQILDKGFLFKCSVDHLFKGDESIGGVMLQFLNESRIAKERQLN